MSTSKTIKMALQKKGMKQADLAAPFGTSAYSMNNKFHRSTWSGNDLIKIGKLTGSKLAYVFPDGQILYFEDEDDQSEESEKQE